MITACGFGELRGGERSGPWVEYQVSGLTIPGQKSPAIEEQRGLHSHAGAHRTEWNLQIGIWLLHSKQMPFQVANARNTAPRLLRLGILIQARNSLLRQTASSWSPMKGYSVTAAGKISSTSTHWVG